MASPASTPLVTTTATSSSSSPMDTTPQPAQQKSLPSTLANRILSSTPTATPPTTRFKPEQYEKLINAYTANARPNIEEIRVIARALGESDKKIKTWFTNKRAKDRRDGKFVPPPLNSSGSASGAASSPGVFGGSEGDLLVSGAAGNGSANSSCPPSRDEAQSSSYSPSTPIPANSSTAATSTVKRPKKSHLSETTDALNAPPTPSSNSIEVRRNVASAIPVPEAFTPSMLPPQGAQNVLLLMSSKFYKPLIPTTTTIKEPSIPTPPSMGSFPTGKHPTPAPQPSASILSTTVEDEVGIEALAMLRSGASTPRREQHSSESIQV
ncbi:hypothetical protein HDV05_004594 [Chytridiales sp. JEL 0842]|nr:hypothetical protein HDV05_004594 [Chytridiales sp. JEL 0842]